MIIGIVIFLLISFTHFINLTKLYGGLIKNKPKDWERFVELYKSPEYKKHKKKYLALLCLSALLFAAVFTLFAFFTLKLYISFFASIICTSVYFDIIAKKEKIEKEKILHKINNSPSCF